MLSDPWEGGPLAQYGNTVRRQSGMWTLGGGMCGGRGHFNGINIITVFTISIWDGHGVRMISGGLAILFWWVCHS